MTEIYIEISKLTDKFRKMAYRYTKDKTVVNEAVQEIMLYFLQMNPDTLKDIYTKDGIMGVTRYGAVALRRALTSPRSNFYYKYKKYYDNITELDPVYLLNKEANAEFNYSVAPLIYNIPEPETSNHTLEKLEEIDKFLDTLSWYDRELFKLYYYYEGNTLDKLATKTRISRNSLFSTIDKVRRLLKKEFNNEFNNE
jgi:RNA polymerase sigma factor (sigma-70 family)